MENRLEHHARPSPRLRNLLLPAFLAGAGVLAACGGNGTGPGDPPDDPHTVEMGDNFFNPVTRTVESGTTVTWVNEGGLAHNTTSDDGLWTSPDLGPGGSFQHTFAASGSYSYECTLHAGMAGTIVVE